jgi:hypothetical protein
LKEKLSSDNMGIADRMWLLYKNFAAYIFTPFVCVGILLLILLKTAALGHEKKNYINYDSIPIHSISLNELKPELIRQIKQNFLYEINNPYILDNPGYLKILVSLDSTINSDSNSCIIYGDVFEDCGCEKAEEENKIRMTRFILKGGKGNNDEWEYIFSGILPLSHYFKPQIPKTKAKGVI